MISRRLLLASAGILILADRTKATQAAKIWRVGYLSAGLPKDAELYLQAFREGLQTLGYIEGKNILIERRFAGGRVEALPAIAQELARLKVDVIVAPQTAAAHAVKVATSSIPVVFVVASDPVGNELVASLSHPGGNVTGITDVAVDLAGKRLDLLKQLVPGLKRVAALGDPGSTLWERTWREVRTAAHQLQIETIPVLIATPNQLEPAFTKLDRGVEALFVAPQTIFFVHRRKIIELALVAKLPAIYDWRTYAEDGGLISYGANYVALFRKAARHVDKILKGIRPADLPVEQPTEFELVINLKTAKALGLTIPQSVLEAADTVIR